MPYPEILPSPKINHIILPERGSSVEVVNLNHPLPFGIYEDEVEFVRGASDQVGFVYRMLGGDVLAIELTQYNVYAAYEDAVIEYSNIINSHQAKNVLGSALGNQTGSFDEDGKLRGEEGELASGSHAEMKFPRFDFAGAKRIADAASSETDVGGYNELYKGRFALMPGQQEYDLQTLMETISETDETSDFYEKIGTLANKSKIEIKKVYFKTPRTMWRFYGHFGGGMSTMGNLSTYGMWADDSQFQVVPVWQNRLQAKAFEETMYVRTGHYSYRVVNNKLRIIPVPSGISPTYMFIEFSIPQDLWSEDGAGATTGTNGVNNFNTLPFENLPFVSINSMGKTWIRRYALATCKEILGGIRSKIQSIPIPGENVTLNGKELIESGKYEKDQLKETLKENLKETEYDALMEKDQGMADNARLLMSQMPLPIYVG